jgi:hypothetical protein
VRPGERTAGGQSSQFLVSIILSKSLFVCDSAFELLEKLTDG